MIRANRLKHYNIATQIKNYKSNNKNNNYGNLNDFLNMSNNGPSDYNPQSNERKGK